MSDLLQEHITKPKSDNMSMDEILASIRRIISTTSTSDEEKNISQEAVRKKKYDPDVNPKPSLNRETSLSAREQLLALTKPNLYDSDFQHRIQSQRIQETTTQPQPSQILKKPVDTVYQKPFYDTLNKGVKKQIAQEDIEIQEENHDAEILQALNEIRETLGHSVQASSKPTDPQLNTQTENTAQNPTSDNPNIAPIKDTPITHSKEALFEEINFRTPQLTGDAVPEFLKKFKKQQEVEKQKNQKKSTNPEYDFSKLPQFNEEDEVLTLTEKIMPMTQQELKQQEEIEKDAKRNLAKLRQGTEEIMKRASERQFKDTPLDEELSDDNAPMVNVIMRTLKPMLQEWIDENMHQIAEQVLRQEFRRGLK